MIVRSRHRAAHGGGLVESPCHPGPSPFILALLLIIVGYAATVRDATAYTLTGFRFDHSEITYSCGSPELQQAVREWAAVSGLIDGGCSAIPDITLTVVADALIPPPFAGYGGAGHIWLSERAQHHYGIMLHETGHALGLGHSAESLTAPYVHRNAAMFYLCCNPINEDDIAGISALYGPEPTPPPATRVFLAQIGTDQEDAR